MTGSIITFNKMAGEAEVIKKEKKILHSFDMLVTLKKGMHWMDFGRSFLLKSVRQIAGESVQVTAKRRCCIDLVNLRASWL